MLTFGGSIKTTTYRKIHEVAKQVEADGVVQIIFATEMYVYDTDDIIGMDSRERIQHAQTEFLSFFMVDKKLTTKTRSFDTKRINDFEYIRSVMIEKPGKSVQPNFMKPVIQEFARILLKSTGKTEE
ncbi:hypothetical protein CJD36_011425 [Flavipsychrobacter stenotrophus]|uniref:Uncharacterized protein n=1 Tax=Flavipsychrobacter stenotrophus TaxID=2077091 RepID=A0A2S7SVC4_9BACT|nr:hypothetical protein [Flavipsychrobacter stenotrophus]PQJ10577.1 hypothetical protein CJD36_011425 [Flavipsychrobacter stenotrophus]